MIRFISAFVLLVIASSARAQTLNLAQSYDLLQTDTDSSAVGTATIKSLSDTTFAIEWNVDGEVTKGFGMRFNDVLACSYTYGGKPGLVAYKIGDNSLDGVFATQGISGTGTERLTPKK
jgi:hypothetical protein